MKLSPESPVEFLAPLSRPPEHLYVAEIASPFGPVVLSGDGDAILSVRIREPLAGVRRDIREEWGRDAIVNAAPFRDVIAQLRGYFAGETAPIRARVRASVHSPFITGVHRRIAGIPFGQTLTYGGLAALAGHPRASRAAGTACGRNRALIVVPCHRVIAARGIGGFGTWPELKRELLRHEGGSW